MSVVAEIPAPAARAPVAKHSSFYLAMRILPPEQREAMYAVYAFCRAVDDIADDGGPRAGRLAMLDQWRADIACLYDGGPTELTQELAGPLARFGMRSTPRRAPSRQIWRAISRHVSRLSTVCPLSHSESLPILPRAQCRRQHWPECARMDASM